MATTETVNINVTDNGTIAKTNKDAAKLHTSLKGAAEAASKIRTPSALAAAKSGSATGGQAGQDSSTARGIGGLTGAAGRDFAAQAQGLGGLVHVYATFAANLFAVSAAFGALSKAADTTNMVKGLDQLGAASGRGLGSLAKRLTEVTDGAISLRDAMTATAQASAGGMSGENIMRLGKVAKQASQALGIDLPNAVSRLSRGITKLEPELLDEIGIMVRVDRASENYARRLGKNASALSDFEKRQGFANAVLEEGEKKFGAINLDANAYSKVLASVQNLTQAGLELINKFLGPLVSLLSESPTALALTLAGITTLLLKQAIPSITAWRQGLDAAANSARKAAVAANELRKDKMLESDIALHHKYDAAVKSSEKALQDLGKTKLSVKSTTLIGAIDPSAPTREQITALEKQAAIRGKLKILDEGASNRSIAAAKNAQLEAAQIRLYVASLNEQLAVKEKLDKLDRNVGKAGRVGEFFGQDAARNRIADRLEAKSRRADIINMVGQNLPIKGTIQSFGDLFTAVGKAKQGIYTLGDGTEEQGKKMGRLAAAATATRGSLAILTSTVTTLVSSIFGWIAAIGLAVVAFQMFDTWVSNSAKEAEKFNKSLETLEEATMSVSRTLDVIANKDPGDILSVESIQAKANAFNELSDAVKASAKDFGELAGAWNKWDKFFDWLKDGFGSGAADKLSSSLSRGVISSLKLMEEGPAKQAAKKALGDLMGGDVDVTNFEKLEAALRNLTDAELGSRAGQIAKEIANINREVNNSAASLSAFSSTMTDIDKTLADIGVNIKARDNITKLGSQVVQMGFQFSEAIKEPTSALVTLNKLVNNTSQMTLLNPALQSELLTDKKLISSINAELGVYIVQLAKAKEEQAKLAQAIESKGGEKRAGQLAGGPELIAKAKALDATIARLSSLVDKSKVASTELVSKFSTAISVDLFNRGSKILVESMRGAWDQAGIIVAKSYLSTLKSAGGVTADFETALQNKEIEVQIKAIEVQFSLIKAIQLNTLTVEKQTLSDQIIEAKRLTMMDVSGLGAGAKSAQIKASEGLKTMEPAMEVLNKSIDLFGRTNKSAIDEYTRVSKEGRADEKMAFSKLGTFFEQLFTTEALTARLRGQQAANVEQGAVKQIQEQGAQDKTKLGTVGNDISAQLEQVKLSQSLTVYYNEQLEAKKHQLEVDKLNVAASREIVDANVNLAIAMRAVANYDAASKEGKQAALTLEMARANIAAVNNKNAQDRQSLESKGLEAQKKGIQSLIDLESARAEKRLADTQAITNAQLVGREAELNYLEARGAYEADTAAIAKAKIDSQRISLDYERESLSLTNQKQAALANIQNQIDLAGGADTTELKSEQAALVASFAARKIALDQMNASRTLALSLTTQQVVKETESKRLLEDMAAISASMAGAFGAVGESIGGLIEQIGVLADKDKAYLENKADLQSKLDKSGTDEEAINNALALAKLEKKHNKDQVTNIANTANATKKMFKEKTAAYKLFDAIEKASHVMKMVALAQETIASIQAGAASFAAGIKDLLVGGANAVANQGKGDPYTAIPRMAAMAAFVASLISSVGGSGSVPVPGGTAAEKQETQGTGMAWVGGVKKETGGGVFGDSEAKSESIVKSLEVMKENTIEGLGYDRSMLKVLESIDKSIGNTAKALYTSSGLRSGSITGSADLSTSSSGIKGLFGKSTTKEIIDSGLLITGTFGDLAKSADGLVKAYEVIRTTTKKSGFLGIGGSTKTTDSTSYLEVSGQIETEISSIFANAQKLFVAAGDKLGMSSQSVIDKLNKINIGQAFTSLRGLKGEELEKEFAAVVGSLLDSASTALFGHLDKFRDFGEGMLETVIRVVDTNDKIKVALDSIANVTRNAGYDITEALAQAAGGLDQFTSQLSFFSDNFLTEAERLAPITKNVITTLSKLGYSFVDTRDEFKDLVKSLDLTSEANRALYQELMDLAPAFAKVYPEIEKVTEAEVDRSKVISQTIEILKLQNKTEEALVLQRLSELAAMDDSLKAGQLYLYALQDEASIKAKLKTAYEKESAAIKTTISAIQRAIKTLSDFKESLLISDKSPLTPLQKYEETKRKAMEVAAIASGIAITDAEKQAKDDAINQLPTVSGNFLEASKTLFASSTQYTADFNTIMDILANTSGALDNQLTESQQQLAVLENNTTILEIIQENTLTTSQLLSEYVVAQAISAQAQAGYSMGLSTLTAELLAKANLNTEMMKMLVAITAISAPTANLAANAPTIAAVVPVMTNTQEIINSQLQASNTALIAEIQRLATQVETLRAEQQQQTADMIATNYDATKRAAEESAWIQAQMAAVEAAWREREKFGTYS